MADFRDFKPLKPSGYGPEATFAQSIFERTHGTQSQLRNTSTVKVSKKSRGVFLHAAPASKKGKGGGWNYRKDFDITQSYAANDVVRVRSAPYSMGWWLCVKTNPAVFGACQAPIYPEPASSGGTDYWHCISLGINQYNSCRGGQVRLTYINLNEV